MIEVSDAMRRAIIKQAARASWFIFRFQRRKRRALAKKQAGR